MGIVYSENYFFNHRTEVMKQNTNILISTNFTQNFFVFLNLPLEPAYTPHKKWSPVDFSLPSLIGIDFMSFFFNQTSFQRASDCFQKSNLLSMGIVLFFVCNLKAEMLRALKAVLENRAAHPEQSQEAARE